MSTKSPGRSNKLHTASTTGLPALLSKKQVAEATGLCERTVDRRIADGTFKAHRIGPRIIRIERDSVLGAPVT
ncbi:MAG: helix-turn-helix domain-containing protein [Actinomycetota bacterium]|nr:helix-turn-helix domain-containing protein [Actinomycetota bacterium]